MIKSSGDSGKVGQDQVNTTVVVPWVGMIREFIDGETCTFLRSVNVDIRNILVILNLKIQKGFSCIGWKAKHLQTISLCYYPIPFPSFDGSSVSSLREGPREYVYIRRQGGGEILTFGSTFQSPQLKQPRST
jgi:hypothetical protein